MSLLQDLPLDHSHFYCILYKTLELHLLEKRPEVWRNSTSYIMLFKRGFLNDPKDTRALSKESLSKNLKATEVKDYSSTNSDSCRPSAPEGLIFTSQPEDGGARTECLIKPSVEVRILSTPGFPKPVSQLDHPRTFRTSHRDGVFAALPLFAGDLIVAERPLTITPIKPPCGEMDLNWANKSFEEIRRLVLAEAEKNVKALFDKLTPERQKIFLSLPNKHGAEMPISGVIRTNGIAVRGRVREEDTGPDEVQYSAVCARMAYISYHSRANCTARWNDASFAMEMYALRDIEAGEELTFAWSRREYGE